MPQIGSVGAQTLSLFGVKADRTQMTALAAAAKAAEAAKAAAAKVAEAKAAPAGGGTASSETEPYGGDYFAFAAKAEAAARKFWAGEAKFAEENGFWRRAIHNVGSYNFAKAGGGGGADFSNREEAMAMVMNALVSLRNDVNFVNTAERKMTDHVYPGWIETFGADRADILRAQRMDAIEATKMQVVIDANYLSKSVNFENRSFLSEENGKYILSASNVSFSGRPLMSLSDNGTLVIYDNDGIPHPSELLEQLTMEKRI